MDIQKLAVALLLFLFPSQAGAQHLLREVAGPLYPTVQRNGSFGGTVAWLGDLDQDGFDDFGVSAARSSQNANEGGSVQTYSGRTGGLLWEEHSTIAGARLGSTMESLGLVDADSVPDVLIGSNTGEWFIRSGADGALIFSDNLQPGFPCEVAAAGDMNGDGTPEYLVACTRAVCCVTPSVAGLVYVISGATHSVLRMHSGTPSDPLGSDRAGQAVASIGDVDLDNRDDYIINHQCQFNFGCPGGWDVYSGSSGTLLYHVATGSNLGFVNQMNPAGDFDGDGINDVYLFTDFSDIYTGQSGVTANDIYSGATGIALGIFGVAFPMRYVKSMGDLNGDMAPEFLNLGGSALEIRDGASFAILGSLPADTALSSLQFGFPDSVQVGGDANGDGVPDILRGFFIDNSQPGFAQVFSGSLPSPSEDFCFGDGGDMLGCTPCPCGNEAPVTARAGCLNDTGNGARLFVQGIASVSDDLVRFEVRSANPSSFALLLSSPSSLPQAGPCPPGSGIIGNLLDGLRCVGGSQLRHGTRSSDSAGDIGQTTPSWGAPHGPAGGMIAQAGLSAGQTRNFQAFYRADVATSCGRGINTTNAVRLTPRP